MVDATDLKELSLDWEIFQVAALKLRET